MFYLKKSAKIVRCSRYTPARWQTNKAGRKLPILLSGRRRGKRKVFWTANPFLAGLLLVYRSCMQLTRRTRNHCYCPALLAQSSFCIVRRCWKQQRFIETFTANGKRQFQVVKFSKKRKSKTSIKGKAFRDFFSLYTLVEICPFNSKGRWTPISLSWFSWFDKIFVFFRKRIKLHRGFVKDHTQGGKIESCSSVVSVGGALHRYQVTITGSW